MPRFQPFSFLCDRRRRASGRGHDRARRRRTPAFMPVGTQAAIKGVHSGRRARVRRRHRARQHLSPDAAAGRRADRGARRAARVHELAAPDPDRFGRLPGDVAVAAAQARRERRHVPLAHRRRAGRADARARDRGAEPARLRHRDAARRMPASCRRPRRDRARDAAVARLGRALQARLRGRRARAGRCSASCRAATMPDCVSQRPRARRYRLSRLRDRRACGRRAAGGDAQDGRGGRAGAARRTSRAI